MVLSIMLTSLEGQRIALVEFWVTQIYCGVTWKYDEVVAKRKSDWTVLCKGIHVPCIEDDVHNVSELVT